jgi:hypothetical protein
MCSGSHLNNDFEVTISCHPCQITFAQTKFMLGKPLGNEVKPPPPAKS